MISKHIQYSLKFLAILWLFVSCGTSGDDPDPPSNPPTSATLQSPVNNEVCLTGVSINDAQSEVSFSWSASQNTDSYDLKVENLNSSQSSTYSSNSTDLTITLTKGEPYVWNVISKSNSSSQTAESATWKFYLAGDGEVNYAPFPATIIHPASGSSVNGPTTYLSWEASDVDNDINSYDVYLDDNDGSTFLSNSSSNQLNDVNVTSGKTYYWKIIAIDSEGNSSDSGTFTFKVN